MLSTRARPLKSGTPSSPTRPAAASWPSSAAPRWSSGRKADLRLPRLAAASQAFPVEPPGHDADGNAPYADDPGGEIKSGDAVYGDEEEERRTCRRPKNQEQEVVRRPPGTAAEMPG